MTTRMTKQQILNVNAEQAKTIHKLREECRHNQQIINQMLHDKKDPDLQAEIRTVGSSVVDVALRCTKLEKNYERHVEDHLRWLEERAEDLNRIDSACARMEERLASLTPSDKGTPDVAPNQDPFLAHEALDRTCMVQEIIDSQLLEHPWILAEGEILDLVDKASTALAKAYQLIGYKAL